MAGIRPTVVCITTHPVLRSMVERHGERFAKIVSLPDVQEFERRALRLHPKALLLDEGSMTMMAHDIARIRKHPAFSALRILVLCKALSPEQREELRVAGASDILLTTHHTPRDIMARLQTLL